MLDGALALLSTAECVAEGVEFADQVGAPVALFALLGLLVGPVMVVRRRWPMAVVLVSLAVTPARMGYLMLVVGIYTLAASAVPRRWLFTLSGMMWAATFGVTLVEMHRDGQDGDGTTMSLAALVLTALLVSVGLIMAPVLLGLYIRARRRLVESLVDRADGLEQELVLLAEKAQERAHWARIEERTRIAREMHDVVAHRVSLMVVHSAALQSLVVRDPERAVRNAELLGDMGRQALDELRQMLGVLRTNGEATDVVRGGPGPVRVPAQAAAPTDDGAAERPSPVGAAPPRDAGTAPRGAREADDGPGLEDVATLVEQSRAAGMAVDLSVEGELRPLRAEAERAAYRVVQEALTNVHKHAPGAQARVRVAYRESEIAVLVENGPSDGRPSAALPSGGNGLVGMRERVTALGGGFVAGPRQDGGFRVSAMVPDRPASPA
ncbi:histidine kinase [Wenjunlia vitaminophila]|uniref:histidine kinase n=1 Tax=Wenjunlia vitaminophila TaxID=76728 RepID=A0A0T6LS22_WENVI|nr:histidine kinase [Wenjunlia vitaminophila]